MTDIADVYKNKMLIQLEKFLNVYNEVAGTEYVFDVRGQYDHLIRILGKYISTVYTPETWLTSQLEFAQDVTISFGVFRDSPYREKVAAYLQTLRQAFDTSITREVEDYLSTTTDFSDDDKTVCREFFAQINALHSEMRQAMFVESTESDVTSKESIDLYKDKLRQFNAYMTSVASNRAQNLVIKRFDAKIRMIAAAKKHIEVLFDV